MLDSAFFFRSFTLLRFRKCWSSWFTVLITLCWFWWFNFDNGSHWRGAVLFPFFFLHPQDRKSLVQTKLSFCWSSSLYENTLDSQISVFAFSWKKVRHSKHFQFFYEGSVSEWIMQLFPSIVEIALHTWSSDTREDTKDINRRAGDET